MVSDGSDTGSPALTTPPLSASERDQWDVDPLDWPHTPGYRIFRALFEEDDNLWWRAGAGHGLNAYEAALQVIDDALAIHVPSTDHGDGYEPYCAGCWEAGGEDGAPSWPCATAQALGL